MELIIIDTDVGGDDAVALFLALAVQTIRIIAITCTYGNTDESNVETNVRKIMTIVNRTDIPIYAGAIKPLIEPYTATDYFGHDGMGDVPFDKPLIVDIDRSKTAAQAMVDLAKENPGKVNILTIGPLTNVAEAIRLDVNFPSNVKKFYAMGSNVTAIGNQDAEFNFKLDPESDEIFLAAKTKRKILISPFDVVLKNGIPKIWRTDVLGRSNTEVIKFLNRVESKILEKEDMWFSADAISVATMVWPELITKKIEARMCAILVGCDRGDVYVDSNSAIEFKNVEIVRDFNVQEFKKILLRYLGNEEI